MRELKYFVLSLLTSTLQISYHYFSLSLCRSLTLSVSLSLSLSLSVCLSLSLAVCLSLSLCVSLSLSLLYFSLYINATMANTAPSNCKKIVASSESDKKKKDACVLKNLSLKKGSGMFQLSQTDFPTSSGSDLRVFYHLPSLASLSTDVPVVFVLHGVNRNAETYRNNWITHAKKRHFAVVVPEFTTKNFPKSWGFNMGNIWQLGKYIGTSSVLRRNDTAQWSFSAIEVVFAVFRKRANVSTKTVCLMCDV